MFNSLKERLKSWITRTKEETEEKIVETPKKKDKKDKKKEKKTGDKKQKKKTVVSKKEKKKKEDEKRIKVSEEKEKRKKKTEGVDKKQKLKEDGEDKKLKEELKKERYVDSATRFNIGLQNIEPDIEESIEKLKEKGSEEKLEKKQGFFSSLFGKKSEKEIIEVDKEKEGIEEQKEKPKKQAFLFFRKTLSEEKFEELFEELELILLQNNVAYDAVEKIKESLKEKLVGESLNIDIENALRESIKGLLINPPDLIEQIKEKQEKPFVILFAGINGSGKTTTIAKLGNLILKNNFSVCFASADTFRAAAIEQLQVHADRLKVPLIKKEYGSDPASVGFEAIKYAKKHRIDVVLIDSAGRMNNRDSLMREIEKISRVNSPDLKIFLGESITGNDATEQARDFNDAIKIDGIILSKADVDEKGGTAISVAQVTKKPIYFLGTGQGYDDLEGFDKDKLIEKIFS